MIAFSVQSWPQYLTNMTQTGIDNLEKSQLSKLISALLSTIYSGDVIFTAGNGGSASTAEHFSADLSQLQKRVGVNCKSICLNSNVSLNSALANDLSYTSALGYQLSTLAGEKGLLVTFSASGNSENLLTLHKSAKDIGVKVWALLGFDGGKTLELYPDQSVLFKTERGLYGEVENLHLAMTHYLIDTISETLVSKCQ